MKRPLVMCSAIAWVILVLTGVMWFVTTMPARFRDHYVQWDTAELIIRFHRQHQRSPSSWEDIRDVYGDGSGLRGGVSVAELQQVMNVEWTRLGELEALANRTSAPQLVPEIAQAKSGRQSHWRGTEPNKMIYEYFRERLHER
jgi:hypothetical protein